MRVEDTFNGFLHPVHRTHRLHCASRAARAVCERTEPPPPPRPYAVSLETGLCRSLVNALLREIERLRSGVDATTEPDPIEHRPPPPPAIPAQVQERMSYAVRPLSEPNEREPLAEAAPPRFMIQREVILPTAITIDVVA